MTHRIDRNIQNKSHLSQLRNPQGKQAAVRDQLKRWTQSLELAQPRSWTYEEVHLNARQEAQRMKLNVYDFFATSSADQSAFQMPHRNWMRKYFKTWPLWNLPVDLTQKSRELRAFTDIQLATCPRVKRRSHGSRRLFATTPAWLSRTASLRRVLPVVLSTRLPAWPSPDHEPTSSTLRSSSSWGPSRPVGLHGTRPTLSTDRLIFNEYPQVLRKWRRPLDYV